MAPAGYRQHYLAGPTKVDVADAPPPPPPKPTPPKAPISGGVLNGKAVRLVQPPYPAIARSARAAGQVRVQIVIDENGNVVSAAPVSGHPLLQGAAVAAARASKFRLRSCRAAGQGYRRHHLQLRGAVIIAVAAGEPWRRPRLCC